MYGTEIRDVQCPYCGERIELVIDTSIADQEYIEDCQVCCRPITLRVQVQNDSIQLQALNENDY
ncbi:MAG: CPXCG motif-containing cysteine-rich protein [bacterium]